MGEMEGERANCKVVNKVGEHDRFGKRALS